MPRDAEIRSLCPATWWYTGFPTPCILAKIQSKRRAASGTFSEIRRPTPTSLSFRADEIIQKATPQGLSHLDRHKSLLRQALNSGSWGLSVLAGVPGEAVYSSLFRCRSIGSNSG